MRQHILATAFAAAVTALAYGQNLNPTVEVTNAYEGGASSIVKPAQQMAVPDSVMKFNLDFDYSVFEKPYQGAYEFKPYYVQLKPTPKPSTEETLFVRLGAGYTLHPELDAVWTPVRKENYLVNVYATHHSYFGRYHEMGVLEAKNNVTPLGPTGEKMKGYLADTKVGADGSYGWDGGVATLNLDYRYRAADDLYHYQRMGGIEASGRVRSLPSDEPHFLYDAALDYHYFGNHVSNDYLYAAPVALTYGESWFNFDGTFGPELGGGRRIVADLDLQLARYTGDYAGYTGMMALTPKYDFTWGRFDLSLGIKISWLLYSDFTAWPEEFQHKTNLPFYPDLHADFHLLDDRLILQAAATGGEWFHTLSGRFQESPFASNSDYAHTRERLRAMIGARGNIASRFRYDFQAGFSHTSHAMVEGFSIYNGTYRPALFDSGYNMLFAQLDGGWTSDSITVDGNLTYRWTNLKGEAIFAPAALTGYLRPVYHWGDRIQAGLDVNFSTARKTTYRGTELSVPGWLDLGVMAEYRFTHQIGFWVKGGNLLNQAIQRNPLHAEAGMYFTLGILLNF